MKSEKCDGELLASKTSTLNTQAVKCSQAEQHVNMSFRNSYINVGRKKNSSIFIKNQTSTYGMVFRTLIL